MVIKRTWRSPLACQNTRPAENKRLLLSLTKELWSTLMSLESHPGHTDRLARMSVRRKLHVQGLSSTCSRSVIVTRSEKADRRQISVSSWNARLTFFAFSKEHIIPIALVYFFRRVRGMSGSRWLFSRCLGHCLRTAARPRRWMRLQSTCMLRS